MLICIKYSEDEGLLLLPDSSAELLAAHNLCQSISILGLQLYTGV